MIGTIFLLKRSHKNSRKHIAIVFVLTFLAFQVDAQKVNPAFIDGTIYFKLKADSQYVISNEASKMTIKDFKCFSKKISKYKVTSIDKPFPSSKDEGLLRTYKLSFKKASRVDKLINELQQLPCIEYAEKIPINKIPKPSPKKLN